LNLWESWADSAAHGWQYYHELTADDWPRMAKHVLHALEHGDPATDQVVLVHFGPNARGSAATTKPRFAAKVSVFAAAVCAFALVALARSCN
jgi:hypothetical protein